MEQIQMAKKLTIDQLKAAEWMRKPLDEVMELLCLLTTNCQQITSLITDLSISLGRQLSIQDLDSLIVTAKTRGYKVRYRYISELNEHGVKLAKTQFINPALQTDLEKYWDATTKDQVQVVEPVHSEESDGCGNSHGHPAVSTAPDRSEPGRLQDSETAGFIATSS